jgi:hypothetical protein
MIELKGENMSEYTIADYRNAPSGIGPLASTWKDKPHRLVYDLCRLLEQRTERWAFTARELSNPAACCGFDELVADVPHEDMGVLIQRNGNVTNRWEDGTAGIPADIAELAGECESPYNPQTNELAEEWRDVVTNPAGEFLRFKE